MQKVYELGDQVHVGSLIAYGDTTDSKLYDKVGTGKTQLKQAVVEQAFLAGKLVVAVVGETTVYYKAIAIDGTKVLTGFKDSTSVSGKTVMGVVEWAAAANS